MSSLYLHISLAGAGYQHKIADKCEALDEGIKYAVMQDTSKRHSDGTQNRQLKWDSSILGVVEELIRQAEDYPCAVGEWTHVDKLPNTALVQLTAISVWVLPDNVNR